MHRKILFLLVAVMCQALSAQAQYLGTVSLQTDQETLAPAGTHCTGSYQIFTPKNLGQGSHFASIVPVNATGAVMEIDGLDASGNAYRISDVFDLAGSSSYRAGSVAGSGYFPKIQVLVLCSPTTATFTLTYTGSQTPYPPTAGAYLAAQIDKASFVGASASANQSDSFQTPFGNSSGTIYFKYASGLAGSTLQLTCAAFSLPGAISVINFSLANTTNLQIFSVPPGACPILGLLYSSGGIATSFSEEYIFDPPGPPPYNSTAAASLGSSINNKAMLGEKGPRWSVVSYPSTGSQASASQAAGTAGVRHVADCITASATNFSASSNTQLYVLLRNGASGAGTVLWAGVIGLTATTGDKGVIPICGLNLIGSAATAMTAEFVSAATGESEAVTLTGFDVQ